MNDKQRLQDYINCLYGEIEYFEEEILMLRESIEEAEDQLEELEDD